MNKRETNEEKTRMKIDVSGICMQLEEGLLRQARGACRQFQSGSEPMTGWAKLPQTFEEGLLRQIEETAALIQKKCRLLIVIGVGGSYLGAKALIDALDGSRRDCPRVVFAGFSMSAAYLAKVIEELQNESTCLCVISKSGNTTEPVLAYSVLREKMFEKYGTKESAARIFVITNRDSGRLREDVQKYGYTSFTVPDDVGGRFSVLSVVGLLPAAAAGLDIRAILRGAADLATDVAWNEHLADYAVSRVMLQSSGKTMEIFDFFEMNMCCLGEWLKQLFGESEGKEGKGAYPASLCFSRDLHSIGQFLQQGRHFFYETILCVQQPAKDFVIPEDVGAPFAGTTIETVNRCSERGVILAHRSAGIPVITIEIPQLDEYYTGQLLYFFEMSCAISAKLLGVNPFDQPGVEAYKREMRKQAEQLDALSADAEAQTKE